MGYYQDIDIILNDIDELREMVAGFREEGSGVPRFIVKLAVNKAEKIKEELSGLNFDEKSADLKETNVYQPGNVEPEIIEEENVVPQVAETISFEDAEVFIEEVPKVEEQLPEEKIDASMSAEKAQLNVINDKISEKLNSLNDLIEKKQSVDIRKALSLNDRFRFQRELFNNDIAFMNKTIDEIETYSTLPEVLQYLTDKFGWDKENPHATDFIKLIIKKYS